MPEPSYTKFDSKIDEYEKGRPGYPDIAIKFACENLGLNGGMDVADIGAGTGLLTRSLASVFAKAIAVEPSAEMRSRLGPGAINGSAENTGLPDKSVNAVFVAQAFHWFDLDKTRSEFRRILKEPCAVILLWNERDTVSSPGLLKLDDLMNTLKGNKFQNLEADESAIKKFFESETLNSAEFPNPVDLTKESFRAMVLSRSYAPAVGSSDFKDITEKLNSIFDEHSVGSYFRLPYRTRVYWGQL